MMPAFVDLIIAVLPVIIVLIIVSFIGGLFDGIISMVRNILR